MGKYYVCEIKKSFKKKKDLEDYLETMLFMEDSTQKLSVVHGGKCKVKISKVSVDFEDLVDGTFLEKKKSK